MLKSLTGGVLRGLAGIAFVVLVPLSAAAQGPLTCRAWTDDPVVSGSTPLRAQHINELRACLEQIIRHLGVTPVDPVGGITVTDILHEPYRFGGGTYIYASFFNNTDASTSFTVWTEFYDRNDQVVDVVESSGWSVSAGGRVRDRFVSVSDDRALERGYAYYIIELTTGSGLPILCSGCGRRPW